MPRSARPGLFAQALGRDSQVQALFAADPFTADPIALPTQYPGEQPQIALRSSVPAAPGTQTPDVTHLAVQIAARMQAGVKRVEIRLDPPELGRIDVQLDIASDGKVTTQLTVERPEALDALMRDARGLDAPCRRPA